MEEIKHKHRALPHAGINPDGDCGPACLAGIMGKSIREIYDLFGQVKNGLSYDHCIKFLFRNHIWYENHLPSDPYIDENPEWFNYGKPSHHNFIRWFDLSKRRLNAGLVGMAQVNARGKANIEDFQDHWVLIYGFKQLSDNAVDKIILVSCPTKGEFEVDAKDFLWKYGGYNTIWIQPPSSEQ